MYHYGQDPNFDPSTDQPSRGDLAEDERDWQRQKRHPPIDGPDVNPLLPSPAEAAWLAREAQRHYEEDEDGDTRPPIGWTER